MAENEDLKKRIEELEKQLSSKSNAYLTKIITIKTIIRNKY
jgi:cell division septum initiation protein DivIVA